MILFQDEETEALLAADFEIGHFFRERIVPKVMIVHVLCAQKWIKKLVPVWNPIWEVSDWYIFLTTNGFFFLDQIAN